MATEAGPDGLSLTSVVQGDFEAMLALRTVALRPSLERLGRFDHARSRERFGAGFVPQHMHHIVREDEGRIGFVTLKPKDDQVLLLDHLYLLLRDGQRGRGVGAWVMRWAKLRARGRAIDVTALRHSDANRFYLRHGFVQVGEETWDLHYRWQAMPSCA